MTLRRLLVPIFGVMCLSFCAGCYFDRTTGKYDDIPELTRENAAVLDQSSMTIEERQRRIRLLQNLERDPIPAYTINGGKIGDMSHKLYKELTDLQYGRSEDVLGWTEEIEL